MGESLAGPKAFYVKLGLGGVWAPESIETGKVRIGWKKQSIDDINAGRWDVIKEQLDASAEQAGKPPQVATTDLHGLRNIAESGPDDVWVTFHQAKLWWAQLIGPVEQDEISKFRRTVRPWVTRPATEDCSSSTIFPATSLSFRVFVELSAVSSTTTFLSASSTVPAVSWPAQSAPIVLASRKP
jgi:hypothetical protein